jgi:hypothetical protein
LSKFAGKKGQRIACAHLRLFDLPQNDQMIAALIGREPLALEPRQAIFNQWNAMFA